MKTGTSPKTGLFLMELVVVILFFSLSAALCVKVFAAAKLSSDYSFNLSNAVVKAQSAAEAYKCSAGSIGDAANLLSARVSEETATLYYDSDWECVSLPERARFILKIRPEEVRPYIKTAEITVTETNGNLLFSLRVKSSGEVSGDG